MILERGDLVDILFGEEDCVVLTAERCLRLTSVPSEILAILHQPRSVAEVRVHLEAIFGEAPEGRLEQVLEDLKGQGVVRCTPPTRTHSADS